MRQTAAALAVGAALAVVAAPAGARDVFKIHGARLDARYPPAFDDLDGPALVAGGVAVIDLPGRRAHVVYRPTGGPSRRLQQFEPLLGHTRRRGLVARVQLSGDGKHLAVARWDEHPDGFPHGFGGTVFATLGSGATSRLHCAKDAEWGTTIDSGLALYLGPRERDCNGAWKYHVRDLATGERFSFFPGDAAYDPTLASGYAIWKELVGPLGDERPRSVVWDVRENRRVYTTYDDELSWIDGDRTLFGTRFERERGSCPAIVVYPLSDPDPRELPYTTCQHYQLRGEGERIAFLAPADGGQRLMLGDTAGSPAKPLTRRIPWQDIPYDFDGERIAYGLYQCSGARVIVVDEIETALADGPVRKPRCHATVEAPDHAVDIVRGFDVRLTCPRGCAGDFRVRAKHRRWYLRSRPWLTLAPGTHDVRLHAPYTKPPSGGATESATLVLHLGQPDGSHDRVETKLKIRRPG